MSVCATKTLGSCPLLISPSGCSFWGCSCAPLNVATLLYPVRICAPTFCPCPPPRLQHLPTAILTWGPCSQATAPTSQRRQVRVCCFPGLLQTLRSPGPKSGRDWSVNSTRVCGVGSSRGPQQGCACNLLIITSRVLSSEVQECPTQTPILGTGTSPASVNVPADVPLPPCTWRTALCWPHLPRPHPQTRLTY